MAEYDKLLSETKIVATIHISNALGTINPIKYIDQAHTYGAAV
jgi:cysteine desulfurase/selenocysteine lyase